MIIAIVIYLLSAIAFFAFVVGKGKTRHNVRDSAIMAILWPWYLSVLCYKMYKFNKGRKRK
jgi:hypothetical protein